jgi:hypothetical protein
MLITVDKLRIGDEIIIGSGSRLKYMKVLREPSLGAKPHWRTKEILYKSLLCSYKIEEQVTVYGNRTFVYNQLMCEPDDHNKTCRVDLNSRPIWLVKTFDGRPRF